VRSGGRTRGSVSEMYTCRPSQPPREPRELALAAHEPTRCTGGWVLSAVRKQSSQSLKLLFRRHPHRLTISISIYLPFPAIDGLTQPSIRPHRDARQSSEAHRFWIHERANQTTCHCPIRRRTTTKAPDVAVPRLQGTAREIDQDEAWKARAR
jgi:hypothetical protein